MKYQPPKYTDKELLEIFPEAKEIIPLKIKEWQEIFEAERESYKDSLRSIHSKNLDELSIWFNKEIIKLFLLPPLIESHKHILRLKRMLSILYPKQGKTDRWQEKLEIARTYPIHEVASNNRSLRPYGDKFSALCPFHEEKHASFYIYPKTNTFHCFACGESGDIIKLTQHLYGLDFKEAVEMLQK